VVPRQCRGGGSRAISRMELEVYYDRKKSYSPALVKPAAIMAQGRARSVVAGGLLGRGDLRALMMALDGALRPLAAGCWGDESATGINSKVRNKGARSITALAADFKTHRDSA